MANTNIQSLDNLFSNLNNVLTTIGNTIEDNRVEEERKKILKRFEDPTKTFFNEDGTPRSPFEIQAEYQSGIFGLLNTMTGRETQDKMTTGIISQLGTQFGLGMEQVQKREQNQLTGSIIEVLNPKALPIVEGRSTEWTEFPTDLAQQQKPLRTGFKKEFSRPYQKVENGPWFIKEWETDWYTDKPINEIEHSYDPTKHSFSTIKSSNYSRIVGDPSYRLIQYEKDGKTVSEMVNTKSNWQPPEGSTDVRYGDTKMDEGAGDFRSWMKNKTKGTNEFEDAIEQNLPQGVDDEGTKVDASYYLQAFKNMNLSELLTDQSFLDLAEKLGVPPLLLYDTYLKKK